MTCDHCDYEGDDVELLPDPYLFEIEGVIEESYWCPKCYEQCAEEI